MTIISPNTLFIGRHLVFLEECASTNSYALDGLNRGNIAEGTIILTDNQTEGRGQRGNQWLSEPGKNLTFSLVLMPKWLKVEQQFLLAKLVSVSLVQVLSDRFGDGFSVKWPNDIFYHDHKVCGVLVENVLQHQHIARSVVGVGWNVNQISFSHERATSLRRISGQEQDKKVLLEAFCAQFEANYLRLKQQPSLLDKPYLDLMYRRGEAYFFEVDGQQMKGEIIGVSPEGKLLVNIENELRRFGMKEISFVF